MTLYEQIVAEYPELERSELFGDGTIELFNDSDGLGDYIKTWNYSKPIPEGLTLGKPGGN
jgi:hypothetical protein